MRYFKGYTWKQTFPYILKSGEPSLRSGQQELITDLVKDLGDVPVSIIVADNGFGKTPLILTAVTSTPSDGAYITTRTHRQIDHFIDEIKHIIRRIGKPIEYVQLGARKHFCINPEVMQLDDEFVDFGCQRKMISDGDKRLCFYNRSGKQHQYRIPLSAKGDEPKLADIDMLRNYGIEKGVCPYYLARILSEQYPITFSSYNYIFDPFLRQILNINLSDKIIMIDECHNIINVMEESLKREILLSDVQRSESESGSFSPAIRSFLRKTIQFINGAYSLSYGKDYYSLKRAEFISLLDEYGITESFIGSFSMAITDLAKNPSKFVTAVPLSKISAFFQIYQRVNPEAFLAYCGKDARSGKSTIKIGVQSLDISPIIKEIIEEGAKLVFMSGTLSPEMFRFRLGLLEGVSCKTHIYHLPKRRLQVWQLSKGIHGNILSTSYNGRKNEDMIADYGATIQPIIEHVPGGSILFFPSYDLKERMITTWNNDKIVVKREGKWYFRLLNEKLLPFYNDTPESKGKVITDFKEKATTEPAVLCAVFRSRASEGEDYVGRLCRAVFILGVPLANYGDTAVQLKISYYNKLRGSYGERWYRSDAIDAVNQACGRSIRDAANDYATIYLMDLRWKTISYFKDLSPWVQASEMIHRDMHTVDRIMPEIQKFYTYYEKLSKKEKTTREDSIVKV